MRVVKDWIINNLSHNPTPEHLAGGHRLIDQLEHAMVRPSRAQAETIQSLRDFVSSMIGSPTTASRAGATSSPQRSDASTHSSASNADHAGSAASVAQASPSTAKAAYYAATAAYGRLMAEKIEPSLGLTLDAPAKREIGHGLAAVSQQLQGLAQSDHLEDDMLAHVLHLLGSEIPSIREDLSIDR